MSKIVGHNTPEENRFKSISDFKWCINNGGEVEIEFHDKIFGIFPLLKQNSESHDQILLVQKYVENQEETERWYDTPDDLLQYRIDGICLRDIITQVEVTDRTI